MQARRRSLRLHLKRMAEWGERFPVLFAKLVHEAVCFIYPLTCAGCSAPLSSEAETTLCSECEQGLWRIREPCCPVCGLPLPAETPGSYLCGDCIVGVHLFDRARAAGIYRGVLGEILHRFKYRGQTFLVRPLAQLLLEPGSELMGLQQTELIIPVPLHPRRVRQRGFNQSALLAKRLGSALRLPVDYSSLKRPRWTEPQTGLSREQRAANVKGAFELTKPDRVQGKGVLIVDDVLTTGETVNQCARVLKDGGAREVAVLTVARTVTS